MTNPTTGTWTRATEDFDNGLAAINEAGVWSKAQKLAGMYGIEPNEAYAEMVLALCEIGASDPETLGQKPGYVLQKAFWQVQDKLRREAVKDGRNVSIDAMLTVDDGELEAADVFSGTQGQYHTDALTTSHDHETRIAVQDILAGLPEITRKAAYVMVNCSPRKKRAMMQELGISPDQLQYQRKKLRKAFAALAA